MNCHLLKLCHSGMNKKATAVILVKAEYVWENFENSGNWTTTAKMGQFVKYITINKYDECDNQLPFINC